MKKILENIKCKYEYFIDENTGDIYRAGLKNKFFKISKKRGKNGNYYYLYCYDNNRYKQKRFFSSYLIGKYILNIENNAFIKYKDNDVFNDNLDNIDAINLQTICEKWVDIRDYKDYLISYNGIVFSKERLQLMQPFTTRVGYKYISLKSNVIGIHRLVYTSFCENFIEKENYVIDHIDNNPSNNSYSNLQYIHTSINSAKDHRNKNDLPTGVSYVKGVYRTHITYTLNNIQYKHVWLGNSETIKEASDLYNRAFLLIENKINPIKTTNNKFIKYCFKNNKWFLNFNQRYNDINSETIFYNTPDEIEEVIKNSDFIKYLQAENKKINKQLLHLSEENALLLNTKLTITKENASLKEKYDKLKIYCNTLLESIKKYKLNKIQINEKIKTLNEKLKEKHISYQERLQDFVNKENYQKNSYNECYTINIPYSDGKRYHLASFANFDIVQELNEIIDEHKYQNNFIEWFNDFKENKLQYYLDKDKAYRIQKDNIKQDRKGYKWFNPRNCWRVNKRYHNKDYLLGYFKNENCCKMMVAEANNALEAGIFEKWVTDSSYKILEIL